MIVKRQPLAHCEGSDGPCDETKAAWFHKTTAYKDENDNWAYMCDACKSSELDYWKEQWDEYYSGQGV